MLKTNLELRWPLFVSRDLSWFRNFQRPNVNTPNACRGFMRVVRGPAKDMKNRFTLTIQQCRGISIITHWFKPLLRVCDIGSPPKIQHLSFLNKAGVPHLYIYVNGNIHPWTGRVSKTVSNKQFNSSYILVYGSPQTEFMGTNHNGYIHRYDTTVPGNIIYSYS